MRSKKWVAAFLVGAGVLGFAGAANATYELTYSGTSTLNGAFDADLFLTTDVSMNVTAISGTRNGVPVTGLSAYANGDNIIYDSYPFVDSAGLSYTVSTGTSYNVYLDSSFPQSISGLYEMNGDVNPAGNADGDAPVDSVTLTAIPEPVSMALFGVAVLGLGLARRGRAQP